MRVAISVSITNLTLPQGGVDNLEVTVDQEMTPMELIEMLKQYGEVIGALIAQKES